MQLVNSKRRSQREKARTFFRPLLENLEDRTMMATLYGITGTDLLTFDTATPNTTTAVPISGLQLGESLVGVDVRPSTGVLYGVGSAARLYTLNTTTGAATFVAALTADPADATNPYAGGLPPDAGLDFNPVPDIAGTPSLRLTSDGFQNLRINANNGLVTTDTDINPNTVELVGSAYTNVDLDTATATTLYGIDFNTNSLVTTANANAGTYSVVGALGVTVNGPVGFDVQTAGGVNTAYAAISTDGVSSGLYTIDLTTGAATLVGSIGGTGTLVTGLSAATTGALRFSSATYSINENGGGSVAVTVQRVGGSEGALTANFATNSGTATAGSDFTDSDQVVNFAAGSTTPVVINIPITNDTTGEGNETFTATLTGASLATPATSTITIVDDELSSGIAYGVNAANALISFNLDAPATILATTPITGTVGSEAIVGIDFRPATGQLFGLGLGSRIYIINTTTGIATQVGANGAFTLSGTSFGFDFNPVPDRIRVTSDADQNLRLNPNDGTLTATDGTLAYAVGDPNAAANPNAAASAYINNVAGAMTTTLYDIDTTLDILAIQNPPNSGTLVTVGALGVDASAITGFDIRTVDGVNGAFATLVVGGVANLYSIDLSTGAASLIGTVGGGSIVAFSILPTVIPPTLDFGDAPDTYGTTLAANGARHTAGTLFLGTAVDAEADGVPGVAATGDDSANTDDEDGVTLPANITAGVGVLATVVASQAGFLDAWVDFNRDGVFGAGEQIAASQPVVAGANNVNFVTPLNAVGGQSYARFRISTVGGLTPNGAAADGEVEDYAVQINGSVLNSASIQPDPANPGLNMLVVTGTNQSDALLIIPRPGNSQQTRVYRNGQVLGDFNNTAFFRVVVFGRDGADSIVSTINNNVEAHGNQGNDVIVTSNGHDFLFGELGDDVLVAGNGNNVLAGGQGNDTLVAGSGRDILIGGYGRDVLNSGGGDDILIGNRVAVENSFMGLRDARLLWLSNASFDARTASLAATFNAATVNEDNERDTLLGGLDRDWAIGYPFNDFFVDFTNGVDRKN